MLYTLTLLLPAWIYFYYYYEFFLTFSDFFLLFSFEFSVRRTLKNGLSEEEKQHVATFIKSYWFLKWSGMKCNKFYLIYFMFAIRNFLKQQSVVWFNKKGLYLKIENHNLVFFESLLLIIFTIKLNYTREFPYEAYVDSGMIAVYRNSFLAA